MEFAVNRPTGEDDSCRDFSRREIVCGVIVHGASGEFRGCPAGQKRPHVPAFRNARLHDFAPGERVWVQLFSPVSKIQRLGVMVQKESLNEFQKRHLLNHIQHADKLLSEIVGILTASGSRSPFPKYQIDVSPAQSKVVQDYIARVRAQMLRVLEAEGIQPPGPRFGAIHAIRVILAFVRIALTETGPKYMRGYGDVPDSTVAHLNGLVTELQGLVEKLDSFLAQEFGQDLQARLEKLQRMADEVALLRTLERIVSEHGLVEFRATVAMIVDRLEARQFEIAVFGRVSSGKSSLLNGVLHANVLPVGVNPITSIPTRLVAGASPRLTVTFVDRRTKHYEIDKLAGFVTEQLNPGNEKGLVRITVELPSPRLREGVVLVDTPGLGSLATSGAVETRAYLPRCDLGVVLVNAGSTIAEEDILTIQALYEAGIPASVLLSKADLLSPADRASAAAYMAEQIRRQLTLDLPVHPVSAVKEHSALLDQWFEQHISPLFARHEQLAKESVRRKVGALRDAVLGALRSRLHRAALPANEMEAFKEVEVDLRKAITRHVSREAGKIYAELSSLAGSLAAALDRAGAALDTGNVSEESELAAALGEMPRLDLGTLRVQVRKPFLLRFGAAAGRSATERRLRNDVGYPVSEACRSYGRLLEAWIRRTVSELEAGFDSRAVGYRARLERLLRTADREPDKREAIVRALQELRKAGSVETTVGAGRNDLPPPSM